MEFVTFEIAKKLKEKGFREKCMWHYYDDTKDIYKSSSPQCYNYGGNTSDAPTISQVLKWLRDEKDIFIEITVDVNDKFNYYFGIYKKGNDTWEYIGQNDTYDYFEMYEEAALAGVKYTLDNLI